MNGRDALRAQQTGAVHPWSYEGKRGPAHWGDLKSEYAACKTGKHQSPIDIRGAKQTDLPPIEFSYGPSPFRIIDNGHTVQVNVRDMLPLLQKSADTWYAFGGSRSELSYSTLPMDRL